MDRMDTETRSRLMSRIGSRDTKPEMVVRRLLHSLGYRYRLHVGGLPGRPDLVFAGRRAVIFVHGCFWHGHNCGRGYRPKSNSAFWAAKLDANMARDCRQADVLVAQGWRVCVIWECSTRPQHLDTLQATLVRFLES